MSVSARNDFPESAYPVVSDSQSYFSVSLCTLSLLAYQRISVYSFICLTSSPKVLAVVQHYCLTNLVCKLEIRIELLIYYRRAEIPQIPNESVSVFPEAYLMDYLPYSLFRISTIFPPNSYKSSFRLYVRSIPYIFLSNKSAILCIAFIDQSPYRTETYSLNLIYCASLECIKYRQCCCTTHLNNSSSICLILGKQAVQKVFPELKLSNRVSLAITAT